MRVNLLMALALAGSASAQTKSDAGAEPTTPVVSAPADAGVHVAAPKAGVSKIELEQLKADLAEVKSQASQQTKELSTQLKSIDKRLSELHADFKAAEARRVESEKATNELKARNAEAAKAIAGAIQELQTGSSNVGPALNYAETVFSGAALRDVQAARVFLRNGDLGSAKAALIQAIADAEAQRF